MATIAELILEQGRQQADARRRQGEIAGQTWQNLANLISRTGQQIEQERVQAPIRKQEAELRTQQIEGAKARTAVEQRQLAQDTALGELLNTGQRPTLSQLVKAGGVERGLSIAQGMRALDQASDNDVMELARGLSALPEDQRAKYYPTARQVLIGRGRIQPQDVPEAYDPAWWQSTMAAGVKPLTAKDQADIKKSEAETKKAEAETKKVEAEAAGTLVTPQQRETERHNKEMETIGRMGAGRAEAALAETTRHNRAMEENARNAKTGRPIIAGDAEDLANFDVSRDELDTLKSVIAPIDPRTGKVKAGATGVGAQIGAAIPAWATDLTGWGVDAKKKQAVIDRVKQIIGKSLEGGVLRKEDEAKYEKILPTVKDTTDVVVAKLNGLAETLDKRKVRRLDALEDAGFNVEKFRARAAAGAAASTVRMRAPNGQEQDVPASQVDHYKSLGATVIK